MRQKRTQHIGRGWQWIAGTWLKALTLGVFGVGGLIAYARQIEPRWLQWKTLKLGLTGFPAAFDNFRLVQITDLHLKQGGLIDPQRVRALVRRVNRWRPDAIVITGDFVSSLDAEACVGIAELAGLRAPQGIYGIAGNHDYWTDMGAVSTAAEAAGVRMLFNQSETLWRGSSALVITGLDNIWEGTPDLAAALTGINADHPVILLAHEPDFADRVDDPRVILQVSGHSHGGQVRIPLLGPLALPDLSYRYPQGLYTVRQPSGQPFTLYTSRGVGLAEVRLRLFCRPEVTLFVLRAESSKTVSPADMDTFPASVATSAQRL